MADRVVVSLHEARLGMVTDQAGFSAFTRSYLAPLLDPADAERGRLESLPHVGIEVSLEWDAVLPPAARSGLEQLGRRIWVGAERIRYSEIWQVPGLQVNVSWRDAVLAVRAAYAWPTRRARWLAGVLASVRERLFVSIIYYLVYFPCAWWLERERGWTMLHASALSTPKGGLVFSGLPGCGKSTAALAALNAPEWRIVSDNLLFTDGSRVFACPEPIHVDARTRALTVTPPASGGAGGGFLRSTGRRFSHRRQDYELAPGARRLSTTPRALGFLHLGRETAVQPVDQAAAVRRLMATDCLAREWMAYQESAAAMHHVWPAIGDHERRRRNLAALARSVPCYVVTIARDAPVGRAMERVARAMLDGNG